MELDIVFYKHLLDQLAEGVYFTDRDRRILYWNHAAEGISGYAAGEVLGSFCHDDILIHVDESDNPVCGEECPLNQSMVRGKVVTRRLFLRHREGFRLPVDVKIAPVFDHGGKVIGAVELFADATEALELEIVNTNLRKLIRIDPLTRLPNRRAFLDTLKNEYLRFARYGTSFAVIAVDIDDFAELNESLGREQGNTILKWMGRKLGGGIRKADTLCRFGGEEFMILLPNADGRAAERAAEKLRRLVESTPVAAGIDSVTASFGATAIGKKDSIDRLLKRAEQALQESKDEGKNRVTRL